MIRIGRALRYARHYRNWRELERVTREKRKPHRVELRNGVRFESPTDTNVLRPVAGVYWKHTYTPRGFEIGADDVVLDVGANFGSFAVYAAKRTRARVVAVEPHPDNVRCLEDNLRRNGCANAQVAACALSDSEGHVELYPGHSGTTHQLFAEGRDVVSGEAVRVRSVPLGGLLDEYELDRVDFMKIDCEGAEGLFLPAASEEALARIRRIAMEFHDDSSPVGHEGLAELLRARGFHVTLRWDGSASNGMIYARRTE